MGKCMITISQRSVRFNLDLFEQKSDDKLSALLNWDIWNYFFKIALPVWTLRFTRVEKICPPINGNGLIENDESTYFRQGNSHCGLENI